jgi:hypothetical protein
MLRVVAEQLVRARGAWLRILRLVRTPCCKRTDY